MNFCVYYLNVCLFLGREHLRLYARLRGLDEASAKIATETGLKKLGLVAYADRYDSIKVIRELRFKYMIKIM